MLDQVLEHIGYIEEIFWAYMGAPGLIAIGLYLSFKSGFFQIRQFPAILKIFMSFARRQHDSSAKRGISPIYVFFASVGAAIGVGNLVGVCLALQLGGPGAVFWMWVAALMGMLVKYGEIYLGVKYRVQNDENSYTGGPMMYLRHVPGGWLLSPLSALLMCLYGCEVFIFKIVAYTVAVGWNLDPLMVIPVLVFLVVGVGQGGVQLVGKICSFVIPGFLLAYVGMGSYVIVQNAAVLPSMLKSIFVHAFSAHAAIGAFAGSTTMLAMSQGIRRACYTGDIGVGYAAIMHAETQESVPSKQAALGVIDIFLDSFLVCTISLMIILVTGVWCQGYEPAFMVSHALSQYFPAVSWIWPLFIFMLGYTTMIGFFTAGRRNAVFLSPKYGAKVYTYSVLFAFLFISTIASQEQCASLMSIVGSMLLLCNLYGLFYLRDQIVFDVRKAE